MKFRIKLLYLLTRDKKGKPTYLSLLELEQRKPNKLPAKCIEAVEVAAGTFDIVAVCQAGTDWPGPGQTGTDGAKQTMDSDRTIHFYSKIRLGTKCGILLTSLTRFSHSFALVSECGCMCVAQMLSSVPDVKHSISPAPPPTPLAHSIEIHVLCTLICIFKCSDIN